MANTHKVIGLTGVESDDEQAAIDMAIRDSIWSYWAPEVAQPQRAPAPSPPLLRLRHCICCNVVGDTWRLCCGHGLCATCVATRALVCVHAHSWLPASCCGATIPLEIVRTALPPADYDIYVRGRHMDDNDDDDETKHQ